MKDFLIKNKYDTGYDLLKTNNTPEQKFIFNILYPPLDDEKIKGGKGIIRNHKLKYLLKKIYKDIKILSLN